VRQPNSDAWEHNVLGMRIPREELESKSKQRVDVMLAAGLESEVRELSSRFGWSGTHERDWIP